MDIPNSGAIFTLGKSYLAENTQSYFYIKSDPVKRLISGPHQSAVICESGRLFVWGKNHYGQLGIGGKNNNNSNNSNNNNNNNADTVTKPTCVKSLKILGLKVADIAFGNDWAAMLTHSNELFFSGRNIFMNESNVARNFTETTIGNEQCNIIRKPFRLEEFDDCLSKSEETENFVSVLAGNEHFAVLTSFGRLIGWGSNQSFQLGIPSSDETLVQRPFEIKLDAAVKLFTCGPESTLVLTESGNLYITGQLSELVFPQFTILQKNLSNTEQIIFMHISMASDIFIVTNAGNIYRSTESVRTKSLIFQRFYDYDSEENGPIWKLLKGFSFCTVLTKANKFYTNFSESGHHLKTFREISKFKNLRLLDMAVGEQHILVHGIPRSSTLSATIGPGGEHRFMSRSFVMQASEPASTNGNYNGSNPAKDPIIQENMLKEMDKIVEKETENIDIVKEQLNEAHKLNSAQMQNEFAKENQLTNANISRVVTEVVVPVVETVERTANAVNPHSAHSNDIEVNNNNERRLSANDDSPEISPFKAITAAIGNASPTESLKSRRSMRSFIAHEQTALKESTSKEKLLRPHTPYPESSSHSTPQAMKKTPLRNFSYEAAMDHDYIEHTSPALVESLENIPESLVGESAPITAIVSSPTPPTEEDEQLTVEINTRPDALDHTIVVNEIRFINNGIDVTANVKEKIMEAESESLEDYLNESMDEDTLNEIVEPEIVKKVKEVKERTGNAIETVGENAKHVASDAKDGVEKAGSTVRNVADDAGRAVSNALFKVADGTKYGVDTVMTKISNEMHGNKIKHQIEDQIVPVKNEFDENLQKFKENSEQKLEQGISKVKQTAENEIEEKTQEAKENAEKKLEQGINKVKQTAEIEIAEKVQEAKENAEKKLEQGISKVKQTAKSEIEEKVLEAKDKAEKKIEQGISKAKDDIVREVDEVKTDVEHQLKKTTETLGDKLESKLQDAHTSVSTMAKKVATGTRDAVETVGENAKQVANDARDGVENAGSTVQKVADDAGRAVGNALFKVADGTKYGVDTVMTKISNQMHGAKENITSFLHIGNKEDRNAIDDDDVSSKDDGGAKTNTTGEDDERTTASVNSTHTSTGNPFESNNPFESDLDEVVNRGKQALQRETLAVEQRVQHHVGEEVEHGKSKMQQFFSDVRAKGRGLSCRNEKSVRIEDEPPRYSVEDELSHRNGGSHDNTSKICSIL